MRGILFRFTSLLVCFVMIFPMLTACESGAVDDCEDGVCVVPAYSEDGDQIYSIVSPVGYSRVESIEQAPRLDSLDHKTIALVGGSFNASVTHEELIRLLKEKL